MCNHEAPAVGDQNHKAIFPFVLMFLHYAVTSFQTLPIFRSLPVSFPPGFSIPKSFLILNIDRGTDGSARIKLTIETDDESIVLD